MGTSCISKPKPHRHPHKDPEAPTTNPSHSKATAIQISLDPHREQLPAHFPYRSREHPRVPSSSTHSHQTLWKVVQTVNPELSVGNYISLRMFSHSAIDSKKYFKHCQNYHIPDPTQMQEQQGLLRISSIEAAIYTDSVPKIQYSPAYFLASQTALTQSTRIPIGGDILPAVLLNCEGSQTVYTRIDSFEEINRLSILKINDPQLQTIRIDHSTLLNGLHWRQKDRMKAQRTQKPILNLFCLDSKGEDQLIFYLNPLLKNQSNDVIKISPSWTYLQLKACLESPSGLKICKVINQWQSMVEKTQDPAAALLSIYLFLTAAKASMELTENSSFIPERLLEILFHKVSTQGKQAKLLEERKHLKNCIDILKLLMIISVEGLDEKKATQLCKQIVKDVIINSSILIQAYIIEFSLQVNQKQGLIRQNPLSNRTFSFPCRFSALRKPSLHLISGMQALNETYLMNLKKAILKTYQGPNSYIEFFEEFSAKWEQQFLTLIERTLGKVELQAIREFNQGRQEDWRVLGPDELIAGEGLFVIRIIKFLCIVGTTTKIFGGSACELGCVGIIYEYWNPIFNEFLSPCHSYCSGELAMVILTLQGLIKSLDPESSEEEEPYFLKAIELWNRTYRDALSKHPGYFPNSWVHLIVKALLKGRYFSSEEKSAHEINYLQNMYACLPPQKCQPQVNLMEDGKTTLSWLLDNLPAMAPSGMFYPRVELLVEEDKSSTQIRTGGSFFDTPCEQLSNRSNFSETHSSGNNSLGKTRKKNRRKVNDAMSLLEHRTNACGVYIWGKGVKSVPLLHTPTFRMDVFSLTCGNYHVLIATATGIYGWGENGSGQLGQCSDHVPPHSVKLVHSLELNSRDDIELSCGNEHSAALVTKSRELLMWGQKEGGITAGHGHKFDKVACGGLHTLGILEGEVYSWGRGEGGQLGHKIQTLETKKKQESTEFFLSTPTKVKGLDNIRKVVCGDAHSVVLSYTGQVFVFGFCYQGQLGLGLTGQSETYQIFQPARLSFQDKSGKNVVVDDIFAGPTFTLFKSENGEVYSCGLNDYGQLGFEKVCKVFHKKKFISHSKDIREPRLGELEFSRPRKVDIFNGNIEVADIYCGENHCLAKVRYPHSRGHSLMGWGHNRSGQLSSQIPSEVIGPRTIDSLQDFQFDDISCGNNFSLGLCRDLGLSQRGLERKVSRLVEDRHFHGMQ